MSVSNTDGFGPLYCQGQGELNVAAWAVSSLVFALGALIYGGLSFLEKEKNYLLAKIGLWMAGGLTIFWICLILAGILNR